jgi:hypothetical protein
MTNDQCDELLRLLAQSILQNERLEIIAYRDEGIRHRIAFECERLDAEIWSENLRRKDLLEAEFRAAKAKGRRETGT